MMALSVLGDVFINILTLLFPLQQTSPRAALLSLSPDPAAQLKVSDGSVVRGAIVTVAGM